MLTLNATKLFYKQLFKEHGYGVRALGWGSNNSQQKRFEAIATFFDMEDNEEISVLDVGCGFADFPLYLNYNFPDNKFNYVGIDFVKEIVREALLKILTNRVSESLKNMNNIHILYFDLEAFYNFIGPGFQFDYVVASGIFSHASYIRLFKTAEIMYSLCKRAVIFNCLKEGYYGNRLSEIPEHEFYADPGRTIAICNTIAPGCVDFLDGYLPNDFTIYIRRENETINSWHGWDVGQSNLG